MCWSQTSYCSLDQISISTIHGLWFWTAPKLWPPSLPALQTSPCVFSDYTRYLFSQMRPADQMARWIIMSFIFKSTALNSQWPNQFKYFLKLRQIHTPTTRRFSHSAHLLLFFFFYKRAEHIVLPTPRWPHIIALGLVALCPGCRNRICPAGPSHLQPNQFVSSHNNGACVWQRWMRAQGSS